SLGQPGNRLPEGAYVSRKQNRFLLQIRKLDNQIRHWIKSRGNASHSESSGNGYGGKARNIQNADTRKAQGVLRELLFQGTRFWIPPGFERFHSCGRA